MWIGLGPLLTQWPRALRSTLTALVNLHWRILLKCGRGFSSVFGSSDFGCTFILHANRKEYKFVSALVSECEALPRAVAHAATDDQVDCNLACTIVW